MLALAVAACRFTCSIVMRLNRGSQVLRWRSSRTTCIPISFAGRFRRTNMFTTKNPFDVISGTAKIREAFEQGITLDEIVESTTEPLAEFKNYVSRIFVSIES